jgi:hypothetical protein
VTERVTFSAAFQQRGHQLGGWQEEKIQERGKTGKTYRGFLGGVQDPAFKQVFKDRNEQHNPMIIRAAPKKTESSGFE